VASLAVNKNKTGGHAEQQAQILATLADNKQSWRLRKTTNSNFDDSATSTLNGQTCHMTANLGNSAKQKIQKWIFWLPCCTVLEKMRFSHDSNKQRHPSRIYSNEVNDPTNQQLSKFRLTCQHKEKTYHYAPGLSYLITRAN
jgi:hypothetical protein